MINGNLYINENNKMHNPNWPKNPGHLYRLLIMSGSGSGKINVLLNLISYQPETNIFMCRRYLWTKVSIINKQT